MGGLFLGIAPVFVLIALGYGLRKSDFLPDVAWRPIEKLSINLLYPGFLIPAIWHADLSGDSAGPAGGAAVVSVIIVAALALAAKPLIRLDGPAYTSVFQGVIRWNSFVFLPVVQSLFGAEGLAVAAVMIACIIPVTNIACVAVLARWGADQRGVAAGVLAHPVQQLHDSAGGSGRGVDVVDDGDAVGIRELAGFRHGQTLAVTLRERLRDAVEAVDGERANA